MIAAHRTGAYFATLALASGLTLLAADIAEARRGGSFGSRGTRTFQMPAPTRTAPTQVAPVERSMTPAAAPARAAEQAARPGTTGAARPGLFGQGFGGTLMRGLLIGGLIGMLFGGGLGGLAGLLGLVLQLGLIALGVMVLMRFLASRRQPVPAGVGASPRLPTEIFRGAAAAPGGSAAPAPARRLSANDEIGLAQSDLDVFERRLSEVQAAFSSEDMATLRRLTTPEVMSYLTEELHENAARGMRNEVRDVRLLQGDLAEAWREANEDFATVAMRFSSADGLVDRASGRVVEGDLGAVTEATELWTFTRRPGEEWRVAAIQEATPVVA